MREITSQEFADRLCARGEPTSVEQARRLLRGFAAEGVLEPIDADRWALTPRGAEVSAGLRAVELELDGGRA